MKESLDPLKDINRESKTHLVFMRHPETMANLLHQYAGVTQPPLSEKGVVQRAQAEEGIVSLRPDRIFSSPLDRCQVIAHPAAERLGIPLITDDRIQELNFGPIEGLTHQEVIDKNLAFPWGETKDRWEELGGEPLPAFTHRISSFCKEVTQYKGTSVIVCHGGVIRAVIGSYLRMNPEDIWKFSVKNVESTIFSVMDKVVYLERFGISPQDLDRMVGMR